MNKKAVIRFDNNEVGILTPAPSYIQELIDSGMTEEESISFIFDKDCEGREYSIHDEDEIPTDIRYRICWRWDESKTNKITVDILKAKEKFMSEMRRKRDMELLESDAEMARLNEIGTPEEISNLKAQRQALRDLPQNYRSQVDSATTLEDLDSVYNSNGGYGVPSKGSI